MRFATQPELIGLSATRLERAYDFVRDATAQGRIPGAALQVARSGQSLEPRCYGRQYLDRDTPLIAPDTIFLIASVTKPVTVAAAMLLVERGQLSLDDQAAEYVPEFGNRGKEAVLIRHLMTHTSGLPDMLPENYDLRREHAPLAEFVRRVCQLPLDFEPGTRMQYQSMGIAILAEVVERLAGLDLPRFIRNEILEPLGMHDTALGHRPEWVHRIAHVNVAEEMRGTDWGWNTTYWWSFAAPWGGMFSTAGDLMRLLQAFLGKGSVGGQRVFSPTTVAAMTCDQTSQLPGLPREATVAQPWGLGWRRAARGQRSSHFGDLLSPGSYGHGGATGVVVWNDPARDLSCVLLTTEPSISSGRLLERCSNLVSAAAL